MYFQETLICAWHPLLAILPKIFRQTENRITSVWCKRGFVNTPTRNDKGKNTDESLWVHSHATKYKTQTEVSEYTHTQRQCASEKRHMQWQDNKRRTSVEYGHTLRQDTKHKPKSVSISTHATTRYKAQTSSYGNAVCLCWQNTSAASAVNTIERQQRKGSGRPPAFPSPTAVLPPPPAADIRG